jgi:hypothetical protein
MKTLMMTHFDLEKIYRQAKNDLQSSPHLLEKSAIESYLGGLLNKLIMTKTPEAEKQEQTVRWMLAWLERQSNINLINIIQVKMINELERQLVQLRVDNESLLTELQKVKTNLK